MEKTVFNYSKKSLKDQKYRLMMIFVISSICMMMLNGFVLYTKQINPLIIAAMAGMVSIVIGLIIYVGNRIFTNTMQYVQLIVDRETVSNKNRQFINEIKFNEIENVKVVKVTDREILSISIKAKNRSMVVAGFENMEDILTLLEKSIDNREKIKVLEKRSSPFDFSRILLSTLLGIVIYVVLMALIIAIPIVFDFKNKLLLPVIFDKTIPIILGIIVIIFKPFSRNKAEQKIKYDYIAGVSLIILSIAQIFMNLK